MVPRRREDNRKKRVNGETKQKQHQAHSTTRRWNKFLFRLLICLQFDEMWFACCDVSLHVSFIEGLLQEL